MAGDHDAERIAACHPADLPLLEGRRAVRGQRSDIAQHRRPSRRPRRSRAGHGRVRAADRRRPTLSPTAVCSPPHRLRDDRRDPRSTDRQHRAHPGTLPRAPPPVDPRRSGQPGKEATMNGEEGIMNERTDDQWIATLGDAIRHTDPVPEHVLAGARAAFTWRTIDAELAELVFDSASELTGVRSETMSRQVTFQAPGVEIEVMLIE